MSAIERIGIDSTPPAPHLRPNDDVIAQHMGDGVVLLHLRTNHFYELNRTASRFWELLSAGYDLAQVQEQMLHEFDVDAAQLASEIEGMIDSSLDRTVQATEISRSHSLSSR